MRIQIWALPLLSIIWMSTACNQSVAQGVQDLTTQQFEDNINKTDKRVLLDVRTPEEFAQYHLKGAINVNIFDNFATNVESLQIDKESPVYVYCLAGSRSEKAANQLVKAGYKSVYNMSGGISTWIGEKRAIVSPENATKIGMSIDDFKKQTISNDSAVFVDFYAPWCAPCQKMKAFVPDMVKEYNGKLKVVMINYDQNTSLVQGLNIPTVPYLMITSKSGKQTQLKGFHSKEELLGILKN